VLQKAFEALGIQPKALSSFEKSSKFDDDQISISSNEDKEIQNVKLELNERYKLVQKLSDGKKLTLPDDTNVFYALNSSDAIENGGKGINLILEVKSKSEVSKQLSVNSNLIRKRQSIQRKTVADSFKTNHGFNVGSRFSIISQVCTGDGYVEEE